MNTSETADHLDPIREKLLEAALEHVPFDGWSRTTLRKAAEDCEIDAGMAELAFPKVLDLVMHFVGTTDATMLERITALPLDDMKVREKITAAVWARLEVLTPHREAERRAIAFFALPMNAPFAAKSVANSVDLIWRAVGDTSTDFNFYSKRGILAGVLTSTILYWLGDDSEDFSATRAFLDRRIADVMAIEKAKARMQDVCGDVPSPGKVFSRMRYGNENRMKP